MATHSLLSAIAENRTKFFELIEALEKQTGCNIDEHELEGRIDSEYDGRERLTKAEAAALLFDCATKKQTGS